MINICRKAFFNEQLKLGKGSFFEVPFSEDYLSVFKASTFDVVEHQITFPCNPNVIIQQALEQRHPGYAQFGNNGVLAVLQRLVGNDLINLSSHGSSYAATKVADCLGNSVAIF